MKHKLIKFGIGKCIIGGYCDICDGVIWNYLRGSDV